jgi:hypothetical protein
MTGTDLSYDQPYGIRPVKRGSSVQRSDEQAARVRAAAEAAAARADARMAELRAAAAPAPRRGRGRRAA